MRSTRKNQRKALKALALGFATAAIFTTTASAQVRSEAASQSTKDIPYLSWGATADDLGPFAAQHVQTPYLTLGDDGPSATALANQSTRDDGPVFMNGVPDGYVGSGVEQSKLSNQSTRDGGPVFMNGVPDGYVGSGVEQRNQSGEGVTPTNLARAYQPTEQGVAQPDGYQPQLQGDQPVVIRGRPDGFQPQTKVESATVSASSDSLDRGDLALGFGLGLILAAACAIALSMTRDRQRTRMAHS